jgi:hypothetical protein
LLRSSSVNTQIECIFIQEKLHSIIIVTISNMETD